MTSNDKSDQENIAIELEPALGEASFIKFYGLYWTRTQVNWKDKLLFGQPKGWTGQGKFGRNFDYESVQMNFWNQKGVYILYDSNLQPVYAGQAGLTRRNSQGGQTIGDRLHYHYRGIYRNGWQLFSWFGFLETQKIQLRDAETDIKKNPLWQFKSSQSENNINLLLASFEAVLIEGFSPRFNSRGGDLKNAVLVDQFDQSLY